MALSSAAAIKSFLEQDPSWKPQTVGVPVYRDRAPQNTAEPYITVSESQSTVPQPRGDAGRNTTVKEMVTVDVWQAWKSMGTNRIAEDPRLGPAIARSLHGVRLPAAPDLVYGVHVMNRVRLLEDDNNVAHDAITLIIDRKM